MKLKSIFLGLCCLISLGGSAQVLENGNLVVPHKKGDPRVKPLKMGERISKYADEIEAWRDNPADILATLGEDLDWAEDVKKAKESGGHVVVAEIKYGEPIEMCMTPADAYNVTHLKLTGRAFKWGAYGPDDLKLGAFLRDMKNLKVLNLRDLDCEIIHIESLYNVEKVVMPANCVSAKVVGNTKLKELITGPQFEAFGYANYNHNVKFYSTDMSLHFMDLGAMTEYKFPEGIVYIGGFEFGKATRSVTFPSTLKVINYFGKALSMAPFNNQQIPSLKEIHVNAMTPPVICTFHFEYADLKNVTLYVPRGSKTAYMKDLKWRNFGAIVEEDVVIAERPVDEDMIIVKPAKESHVGKWKFAKSEITDMDGKNRRPGADPGLDYMVLDGQIWQDVKFDGSTIQNKYKFINNSIYLGTTVFHVDKLDDKELVLSAIFMAGGKGYKSVFTFERME